VAFAGKQIVLKREYTYQRTMTVKGENGTETQKTMKLKTPHSETHCICPPAVRTRTFPGHCTLATLASS
tara:strand:- start:462 stop:668 length:207 start_codon:yes stop_codon:yes gene_type:complete